MDFVWTRTYRSRPESPDRHWDHGYALRAEAARGGIRVWTGTGCAVLFRPGSDGGYTARGVFAEGRLDPAAALRLRFSGGGTWEFRPLDANPAAGCIARIADRNGNALSFGYDPAGRLAVVTDTLGRDIRIGCDRAGRVASLTDFTGRRVSYRYTADGDLAAVTLPAVTGSPTGDDFPDGVTIRYSYAEPHRLTGITDRAGNPLLDTDYARSFDHDRVSALHWADSAHPVHISYEPAGPGGVLAIVNDANGNVRELTFDADRACVSAREHTGHADAAQPTTATSNRPARAGGPPWYETRYEYDNPDGLLTRIVRPDGSSTIKEFEIVRRPDAGPLERGNLRSIRHLPGPAGAQQPERVRGYDYLPGFGCTCAQAFVTRETDPRGGVRTTAYDQRGNAVALVDRDGSRTELSYNSFGELTGQTRDGRRDTFEYCERHGQLCVETIDADGLAQRTTYRHDELGRPTVIRDAAGVEHEQVWNEWDLVVRRVLPDGVTEDTRYDANTHPVALVIRAAGRKTVEDRTYDRRGRLLTVARATASGRDVIVAHEYDGNGNRVCTRRGEAVVRESFDALDRLARRTRGAPGKGHREVSFDYDAAGNMVRITRGAAGEASVTTIGYDGHGRQTAVTIPNGTTVRFTHDPNGNVVHQVIAASGTTRPIVELVQAFDAADRLVRRSTAAAGATETLVETWEFDSRGRLVRHADAAGRDVRTRYDALDRRTEVTDSAGWVCGYTYDANSNLVDEVREHAASGRRLHTHYRRDRRGRVVEIEAPRGGSRTIEYAEYDRPAGIGWPGGRMALDYDGAGLPTTIRWTDHDGAHLAETRQSWSASGKVASRTDPGGNTTRYRHDPAGQITGIEHPDGVAERFTFDSRGNCVGWTDANGTRVVNTFDVMDRLVRGDVTPGVGVADDTTTETYSYDALGRITRAANDRHTVEWDYDGLSRVVRQVQDGRKISAGHDAAGRRTSLHYPAGYYAEFEYTPAGLARISDDRGAAVELGVDGSLRFARAPLTCTAHWDAAGLPAYYQVATNAEGTLDERRYRWDAAGNLTGVQESDGHSISYTADVLGRLRTSQRSGGPAVRYGLDAAGNRTELTADDATGRYTSERNRYLTTPRDRRDYDANGNLIRVTGEHGTTTMVYDYLNRMVEYRDEGTGLRARYGYDCLGRRLVKTVTTGAGTTETRYVYDGDALLEQQDAAGTQSLLRHGDSVYGVVNGSAERWFVRDVLGSVVAEVDATGAAVRTHRYDDFGRPAEPDVPPVSFAGYTFDRETGFYYVRARYLEPATGRFTTPDPAGAWEDGRCRGNAYTYAGNNPVTFVDPTGLFSVNRYHWCSGPWPGPRTIKVQYEDCSKARRDFMRTPVCRAFRASGQASENLFLLWANDYTGISIPGASTTRAQVTYWFGGPDNSTSLASKEEIWNTLDDVIRAIKSDDFDIDCEGSDGNCEGASAYVVGPWGDDINVCNSYFNNGWTISMQAGVLIHELTHAYNDTADHFYYDMGVGTNKPYNLYIETTWLRENADNYRALTQDYYMP